MWRLMSNNGQSFLYFWRSWSWDFCNFARNKFSTGLSKGLSEGSLAIVRLLESISWSNHLFGQRALDLLPSVLPGHKKLLRKKNLWSGKSPTCSDILPNDLHEVVSVISALHVVEAQRVQHLVHDGAVFEAAPREVQDLALLLTLFTLFVFLGI